MEVFELCHDSSVTSSSTATTSTTNSLNSSTTSSNDGSSISSTNGTPNNTNFNTMSNLKNENGLTGESRQTVLPSISQHFPSTTGINADSNRSVNNHSHHHQLPAPKPTLAQPEAQQTSPSGLKSRHQYQMQYQVQHQHQHPKSYRNLPLPPALADSTAPTAQRNNHNNTSSADSPPTPGYYHHHHQQPQQPYHHYSQHSQPQPSQQQGTLKHLHQRPIAPHPSSTAAAAAAAAAQANTSNSTDYAEMNSFSNNNNLNTSRKRPLVDDSLNEDATPTLKKVIQQCTSVYQKIGTYRVDPLTEAERNRIIDDVFSTTETVLKLLNDLHAASGTNTMAATANKMMDNDSNHTNKPYYTSNNEAANDEYELIRQARNLQKNSRSKYRRRSRTNMLGHRCHSCNTTDTPEWRRGPDGARTLCNACGLHYSKLLRKGSLTVQTHNYMIEPPPTPHSPPPQQEQRQQQLQRPPVLNSNHHSLSRATVEYPVIQVPSAAANARGLSSTAAGSSSSATAPTMHHVMASNPRITELKEEED